MIEETVKYIAEHKNNYKKIKSGNNISNKSIDEIKEYILSIESY